MKILAEENQMKSTTCVTNPGANGEAAEAKVGAGGSVENSPAASALQALIL